MASGFFRKVILGTGLTGTDNGDDTITLDADSVTFGTPSLTLGTANAAGSTDEVIRRNATILAFDATAPSTQAFGDAAAAGSATVAARRDHKHGMPANPSDATITVTDVTTNNATTGQHGFLKKLSGTASDLLNGAGNFIANINSLCKSGSTPLTGAVTLTGGANVVLTQTGNDIAIAAVAGGGGGTGFIATDPFWDAAGDLAVGTGADTASRLGIGSSGTYLKSNGTTAAWSAPTVGSDGWVDDTAHTWTFASASTFTISGVDLTAVFTKGTRLRFTQTTVKYGVVASSSFSTNTTVTIVVNTDYVLANAAISVNSYSYAANPQGYPGSFAYSITVGASTTPPTLGTGGTTTGRFSVVGNVMHVNYKVVFGSSGEAAGSGNYLIPMPVNITSVLGNSAVIGSAFFFDNSSSNRVSGTAQINVGGAANVVMTTGGIGTVNVGAGVPWTWAANDQFSGNADFEF